MTRALSWLESDRATRWIGYATLIVVIGMFLLAFVALPTILDNTQASRRTDDLSSCRAGYVAEVYAANVELAATTADVLVGLANGLVAAVQGDDAATAAAVAEVNAATVANEQAKNQLKTASDNYSDAVAESQSDPNGFVDRCKESS